MKPRIDAFVWHDDEIELPVAGVKTLEHKANPDHSTSSMIAIDVPDDVASVLALVAGAESLIDDPHVTMMYLGRTPVDTDRVVAAVESAVAGIEPFEVRIGGWGLFDTPDGWCLWAAVDAKPLSRMRTAFEDADEIEDASEHGFTPHTTVRYTDAKPVLPDPPDELTWTVTHVSVHSGEDVVKVPLQ